jgi:hypothetical protein
MEMVKLFRFNYTTQERLALQMFPRAQTHADNVRFPANRIGASVKDTCQVLDAPEFIHNLLRNTLSILLAANRVGQDNLVNQLSHGLLEPSMVLVMVWTREARGEPRRLCIWDLRDGVRREWLYLRFLALDGTNLQARVLRTI